MDRTVAVLAVVIVILTLAGTVLIFGIPGDMALSSGNSSSKAAVPAALQNSAPEPNAPSLSMGDVYLCYRGGTASEIYLVSSEASFGRFTSDVIDEWSFNGTGFGKMVAAKGDPFMIITGTIRNDESQGVWVGMLADLYNDREEKIGTILRTNGRPEFYASYLHVPGQGIGNFSITLTYDKKYSAANISRYDIYLAWIPTATAPP